MIFKKPVLIVTFIAALGATSGCEIFQEAEPVVNPATGEIIPVAPRAPYERSDRGSGGSGGW